MKIIKGVNRVRLSVLLLVFTSLCVVYGVYFFEQSSSDTEANLGHSLIQLWVGSGWPGSVDSDRSSFWFACAVASHIMLNVASFVGFLWILAWIVVRFLSEERLIMNFMNIIQLRDIAIRTALRRRLRKADLPEDIIAVVNESIKDAFNEGSSNWENEHLKDTFGENVANKINHSFKIGLSLTNDM